MKTGRAVLALFLFLALTSASTTVAMHPTHPEGFSPEKAYQPGLIDNVDLFSGALGLSIPIGPFQLNYGSSIWTYDFVFENFWLYIEATPNRKHNAGLGWYLGWGEVYSPDHWVQQHTNVDVRGQ